MIEEFSFIAKLPGLIYTKDIHSRYAGISQAACDWVGWKHPEECHGKTDYDLKCDAVTFAPEFIENDKTVMNTGIKSIVLSIQKYIPGWKIILVERIPLKNTAGEVIGVYSPTLDVTCNGLFRTYVSLHQSDNKLSNHSFAPANYLLSESHCPLPLTHKQQNCLFLLIRGKSQKEIAKILKISPRTVECHIDTIKNKINCQYTSDVIEKAIDSGFLYYIPKDFQHAGFNEMM